MTCSGRANQLSRKGFVACRNLEERLGNGYVAVG